ncbi:STAS domain-containing protein, partial [Caulobacter sp. 602-1]|uniref:STAS domain-containing protein n=1 Tax=Caulobacter sp. 602-1 TaxID=2492472 RepID=UPI000F6448E0
MAAAIALPETLDLKAAAPLKAAFLERRGTAITVEADQVRRLGGLCLQVLLAARKAWDQDGQA